MAAFKNEYYLRAYQRARDGLSEEEIAKGFGATLEELQQWREENSDFDEALRDGYKTRMQERNKVIGMVDGLDTRQRRFIEEFPVDLNASAAAVRAGYAKKYTASIADHVLTIPAVQEAIREKLRERAARAAVNSENVLYELAYLAFSDYADFVDGEGDPIDIRDLPAQATRAVQSFKITTVRRQNGDEVRQVDVTLWNKVKALELLAKHLLLIPAGKIVEDHSQHVHIEDNDYEKLSPEELLETRRLLKRVQEIKENGRNGKSVNGKPGSEDEGD